MIKKVMRRKANTHSQNACFAVTPNFFGRFNFRLTDLLRAAPKDTEVWRNTALETSSSVEQIFSKRVCSFYGSHTLLTRHILLYRTIVVMLS